MKNEYRYNAVVTKIVDGDTFGLDVDVGFYIKHSIRARLHGIDTPELRSKILEERKDAIEAKNFVAAMMPVGTKVVIDSIKVSPFGRWEAIVYLEINGKWVNLQEMISEAGFDKKTYLI